MNAILGTGNGILDYVWVVLIYAGLFHVVRQAVPRIELNFRRSFWVLYAGWAGCVFVANFLLYLAGFMSFLPWLNNFMHTFVWIGFCLGFVYAGSFRKPLWEQFPLFAFLSFIVKWAEKELLGTWEHGHFFYLEGNLTYILGWSLMDGLYPVLSAGGLRILSRWIPGLADPSQTG